MTKFCFVLAFLLTLETASAQNEHSYPPGVAIDPNIERICKSRKDINSFNSVHLINDSISSNPLLSSINKLPLTGFVAISSNDTLLTFMGMPIPWGFQITLKATGPEVVTFVSSKSCKCFKDNLSKTEMSYGVGSKSTSLTLVLNKQANFKPGEKIYGYINTKGGDMYHFLGSKDRYEKWNFQYEGFFMIEFQPINQ